MTEADIMAGLTEIFEDVFDQPEMAIAPASSAKDVPGWDSFKQIEIIMAVEARFKIKLLSKEIDRLKTVGDLVAVVSSKLNKPPQ